MGNEGVTRLRLQPPRPRQGATSSGSPLPDCGNWRRASAALVAGAFAVTTPGILVAQTSSNLSPDAIRQKLEAQRGALEAARSRESTLTKDVQDIDAERERLNSRLLETAALIQKSESKLTSIEARLGELEAQERLVRGSLEQQQEHISKLLGALQRMGRNPPPVMITRREDALQMVRSAMMLASAFPELRGKALDLAGKLRELVRVMTDIRTESAQLKAETQRLTDAQTKLAGLMEERKDSLSQRRAELAEVRKTAATISQSVTSLSELIAKLDQAVTEKTGLAQYEREVRASEPPASESPTSVAAASPPAAAPTPGSPIVIDPAAPGAPQAARPSGETKVAVVAPKPSEFIELRPGTADSANAGRIKPAIAFSHAKGRLPRPAHGRSVLNFGEKTQYGGVSKGVVLETRWGAQITSPTDGWVVYAGEFRSYGQLLIINAGGGYHILLAGLSRIDVEPGQFVLAAEPVGTMSGAGSSGAGAGKAEGGAPVLYVEFRKDGRPIDPSPWWVNGPEKVEG